MFEHRSHRLLSRVEFLRRQARHAGLAAIVVGTSLGIGALGYHHLAGMTWIDSVYNAAMILTGMGPAADLHTDASKVFVTVYAMFSGVVFVSVAAVLIAPGLHRMLHILHLDEESERDART